MGWEERDLGCCCSSGADGKDGAGSGASKAPGAGLAPRLPSVKDRSWWHGKTLWPRLCFGEVFVLRKSKVGFFHGRP